MLKHSNAQMIQTGSLQSEIKKYYNLKENRICSIKNQQNEEIEITKQFYILCYLQILI